jgi:choline dehydrogenase
MEDYPEGDETRGTGGPVKLVKVAEKHPVITSFLKACEETGWARAGDFNGIDPEGYEVHQLNVRDGKRQSSAVAFLDPLADADNLTVVTDAVAQQIVLDDGRVIEVVFKQGGEIKRIRVEGEVIVSAGCIGSPQVLLLSGIGPKDQLEKLGIDVVLDLPAVGENLHDHIGVPVAFEASKPLPESEHQAVEVGMYCRSEPSKPHYDIQVPVQNFPFVPPGTDSYAIKDGFTFYPGIMKPKSRGRISLRSSDPDDRPLIDPAYLQHPDDLALLTRALEVGREVGQAHAFDEIRKSEAQPGPDVTSAKDVELYIRERAATYFHPVGGCKMGSGDDAVVDERLKVRGIENMRVADASVMPEIISGNTNAPSMMIGWRAAEFVLSDAGVEAASAA